LRRNYRVLPCRPVRSIPKLTRRGIVKLNLHLRLNRGDIAIACRLRILPFPGRPLAKPRVTILGASASFGCAQPREFYLAKQSDRKNIDLIEMRRQLTALRSQHAEDVLVTSILNRFIVKVAFLLEPKDLKHAQLLQSEFSKTLEKVKAINSRKVERHGLPVTSQTSNRKDI